MHEGNPQGAAGAGAPATPEPGSVRGSIRTAPIGAATLLILGTVAMAVRTGGAHTRAASGAAAPRPDVVVLAVDGLAPEDVSARDTPFLAELRSDAVAYRDAYAPSPWAGETLEALLFGRHRPPLAGEDGWTPGLADELGHPGYRSALVPGHARHALGAAEGPGRGATPPAGFDEVLLPAGIDDPAGAQAAQVVETALDWFDEQPGPALLVVSLADPRAPHHHYRGGDFQPDADYAGPVRSGLPHDDLLRLGPELGEADLAQLQAFHATELAAADAAARSLLRGVRRRSGPPPIVAIVGLRQAPLGERGRFGLIPSLEPEDLRVPMWLQLPSPSEGHVNGVLRGVVGAPVSLLDLEPTVLGALGLAPRRDLDGSSVYPGAFLPERPIRAATARGLCAALGLDGDRAVILETDPPAARARARAPRSSQRRAGVWSPSEEVTAVDADLRQALARWMARAGFHPPGGDLPALEDAPFRP